MARRGLAAASICWARADARLIRQPSSMALPRLVGEKFTADAAFVDGSHRFHEVFVDLYFLRKIVRPAGLVIVDDYGWPSVHTAVHYFESNMRWLVVDGAFDGGTIDEATRQTRAQALRLPDPPFEPAFEQFQPFHKPSGRPAPPLGYVEVETVVRREPPTVCALVC
jgi:Methyltransferase domain